MKNMKAIALLGLAVLIGLAAAVYAASWLSQRGSVASTKIAVAAVDIELGSKINPQMLTTVDWPSGALCGYGPYGQSPGRPSALLILGLYHGAAISGFRMPSW